MNRSPPVTAPQLATSRASHRVRRFARLLCPRGSVSLLTCGRSLISRRARLRPSPRTTSPPLLCPLPRASLCQCSRSARCRTIGSTGARTAELVVPVCSRVRARLSSTFGRASLVVAPLEPSLSRQTVGGLVPRVRCAAYLDAGTAPIPSTHRPALVRGPVPFSGRAVTRDLVRVALGPSPATSHVATQLHVAARLRPLPHLAARPTPTVLSYYVTSPLLSRSSPVAQAVLGSWALPNNRMNRSAHS